MNNGTFGAGAAGATVVCDIVGEAARKHRVNIARNSPMAFANIGVPFNDDNKSH